MNKITQAVVDLNGRWPIGQEGYLVRQGGEYGIFSGLVVGADVWWEAQGEWRYYNGAVNFPDYPEVICNFDQFCDKLFALRSLWYSSQEGEDLEFEDYLQQISKIEVPEIRTATGEYLDVLAELPVVDKKEVVEEHPTYHIKEQEFVDFLNDIQDVASNGSFLTTISFDAAKQLYDAGVRFTEKEV